MLVKMILSLGILGLSNLAVADVNSDITLFGRLEGDGVTWSVVASIVQGDKFDLALIKNDVRSLPEDSAPAITAFMNSHDYYNLSDVREEVEKSLPRNPEDATSINALQRYFGLNRSQQKYFSAKFIFSGAWGSVEGGPRTGENVIFTSSTLFTFAAANPDTLVLQQDQIASAYMREPVPHKIDLTFAKVGSAQIPWPAITESTIDLKSVVIPTTNSAKQKQPSLNLFTFPRK